LEESTQKAKRESFADYQSKHVDGSTQAKGQHIDTSKNQKHISPEE